MIVTRARRVKAAEAKESEPRTLYDDNNNNIIIIIIIITTIVITTTLIILIYISLSLSIYIYT